jgi:hypothetical protein
LNTLDGAVDAGDRVGRLELPLPEMGKPLEEHAKHMEARIKAQTPKGLRDSIVVRTFRRGKATGLAVEYDDRAENFVYAAIEYPRGGGKEESVEPR